MTDAADYPLEILNNRIFPVDRPTLFNAFADPEKLKQWWGPDGFINTISTFDFRKGGDWHITMTSPDGTDFDNHLSFTEIVVPERIAFIHHGPMHVYLMTMTFTENEGGTGLSWRMQFEDNDDNRKLEGFIRQANEQNFDRLKSVLQQQTGKR